MRVVESNAKTLREATHMNCHTKKKVDSPALLKFFKRAPAKKFAVEFTVGVKLLPPPPWFQEGLLDR